MTEDKKEQCEKQFDNCMNDDMQMETRQFWHLTWVGALAAIIMATALYFSPQVFDSVDDPEGLYRWALFQFPKAFATIFILLGSVCLADLIFPGDLLTKVLGDSKACAIVIAALFLAVGFTLG